MMSTKIDEKCYLIFLTISMHTGTIQLKIDLRVLRIKNNSKIYFQNIQTIRTC